MRHCPQCGEGLVEGICPGCGYGGRKTKTGPVDSHRGTCENIERGLRCANRGPYSSSTTGTGPWYCFEHFPPFMGWHSTKRTEPPGGFAALRALTKSVWRPPVTDFEAVAERLALQEEPPLG